MVARVGMSSDDAGLFWRVFERLTRESLNFNPNNTAGRFSGICRDSTPWQFCVVLGAEAKKSVRFLTEIGSPTAPLTARTQLTVTRFTEICGLIGIPEQGGTAETLASLTPADDEHIAGLWVGFAMNDMGKSRVRLYANNGWGDLSERWLRLIDGLRRLNAGGFGARLEPLLPLLLASFSPAGLAVTLSALPPVCKLYLRPIASPWLATHALARAVLGQRSGSFISALEGGLGQSMETLPERALIVSMAGSASGGPLDLKLDLCGHCLFQEDTQATRIIERLAALFELDASPYHAMIENLCLADTRMPHKMVAFVGVGANPSGECRMNLYLTPPAQVRRSHSRS